MRRSQSGLRFALAIVGAIGAAACADDGKRVELTYELGALIPDDVARIETIISVDPNDGREFFADQPYRSVALGVGYEVRDIDGDGVREVVLLHDASLGFVFTAKFSFKLLPPAAGDPPAIIVRARAYGSATALGETSPTSAFFASKGKAILTLASTLCGEVTCLANQRCCGGKCVDTTGDQANCGDCGAQCGSEADGCKGGVCRCAGGAACAPGQSCCAGVGCVDQQADRFNCGGCGNVCNPGESCVDGACKCGGNASCGKDGLCCADTGACSTTGSCDCGGSATCTSPEVCCDAAQGQCANLMGDNDNCGSCGKQCAAGLACQSGSCRCAGQICASGDACCSDGCKTLANDTQNCGQCGKPCRAGEACVGGQCRCGTTDTCTESESCCGTTCSNTKTDARNCGGCRIECRPGESCGDGHCQCNGGNACAPGRTCCPAGATTPGGCVDLANDPLNCNECGNACGPGYACQQGACVPTLCNPPCTNGNSCVLGVCKCDAFTACGGNLTCCGKSGCVDTTTNPKHCARCDSQCPSDANVCCNSVCIGSSSTCLGSGVSCSGQICPIGQQCCFPCATTNGSGSSGTSSGSGSGTCGDVCADCPTGSF